MKNVLIFWLLGCIVIGLAKPKSCQMSLDQTIKSVLIWPTLGLLGLRNQHSPLCGSDQKLTIEVH